MKCFDEILARKEEPRQWRCDTHGEFTSRNVFGSIWTKCPECSKEIEEKEATEREAREKAEAMERWEKRLGHAGIPERFRDRSLKAFIAESAAQRHALDFATAYAENFDSALTTGRSALFLGKPGTGKTHLAIGIGLRIMHRDSRKVLFSTVMRAIRRIKDTWNKGSDETETEAVAVLTHPDLLILDEIGVQFGSDTEKMMLFDVLNERYEKRRPTLLLSNLTLEEVKVYLGERIFDRLREDGGDIVVFTWESHRGRVAA